MSKSSILLFPQSSRILEQLGEQIKLARLRRKFSAAQVAERANMGRSTLIKLEKGHPGVSLGHVVNVLRVLGLESDVLLLAKDDVLGRKLQDAEIQTKQRAPKRRKDE